MDSPESVGKGSGLSGMEIEREELLCTRASHSVGVAARRHDASKCRHRRHQVATHLSFALLMRKPQYLSQRFMYSISIIIRKIEALLFSHYLFFNF